MKKFLSGVLACLLSGNLLAKDVNISNVSAVKSNAGSKVRATSVVGNFSNDSKVGMATRETSNEKFVVQNGKMVTLREINYQGWIGNTSDTLGITDTLSMSFRIYDAVTSGTLLWSDTYAEVAVIKGVFNVLLGSDTTLPLNIFTGAPLWLETQVGSEILSPRKKMVTVGSAIYADKASYADYAGIALADTLWKSSGSYIYPSKAPEFKLYSAGIGLCYVGNTNTDAITNWHKDNTQTLINYRDPGNQDRYAGKFITNGDSSATDYGIYAKSGGEYAGYFDGNVKVTGRLKALNLPGVVSTSSNRHITLAATDSIADSVVVNVPDSGVVVVTLTGVFQYNHTNGVSDIARASISTTRALTYYNLSLISTAANDETSSDFYLPYTTTLTEEVVAGSHIYYAAFDTYTGQAETIRYFLTATYYPKSYGTVTKSFKNEKSLNGPESR
ncbi:MAG: hypothetical protein PHE49_03430 [bacterium]|nr:hypothetical protein [bacterium]